MMLSVAVFITGCDAKDSNDSYEGTYQLYSIATDEISENSSLYYLFENGYYISYVSATDEVVDIDLRKIEKRDTGYYHYPEDRQIKSIYIYEYKDMGDGYIYVIKDSGIVLLKYTDDALLYIQKETYQYFKKID